ncbi:MAG TPA: hypothetical protein VEZ40_15685 [Pyrinomonadaceae bacterium]|nr:hypothetical protein [Pyrinomonadaceae bacterium]
MKLKLCCLTFALCAFASPAFADVAPPPNPTPAPTPQKVRRAASLPAARMLIESRRDATEARLQIPRNMLGQLRAELEREEMSGATTAADSLRPAQTIIAGVFLSLSLAFAGIFLARTRSRAAKQAATAALVVLAATGALAIKTLANVRPPEPRTLDAGSLKLATTPDAGLNGVVRVEVVEEHNVFKLIVPAAKATTAAGSR